MRGVRIDHQYEIAPRQPAAGLEDEVVPDLDQRLVAAALLAAGALGGNEGGVEWQRPELDRPKE